MTGTVNGRDKIVRIKPKSEMEPNMMIKSECSYVFRVMAVLAVACTMFGCEETYKALIVGGGGDM